jgi:hypothetical protein
MLGAHEIVDSPNQIGIDPLNDEPIRGEQPQRPTGFDRLKGSHPSIELGIGQLRLE